jgi:hypothetical protein
VLIYAFFIGVIDLRRIGLPSNHLVMSSIQSDLFTGSDVDNSEKSWLSNEQSYCKSRCEFGILINKAGRASRPSQVCWLRRPPTIHKRAAVSTSLKL